MPTLHSDWAIANSSYGNVALCQFWLEHKKALVYFSRPFPHRTIPFYRLYYAVDHFIYSLMALFWRLLPWA